MPPLPDVPNVVRIVITNIGNDAKIAENVLHWTYGGTAPETAVCNLIATAVFGQWEANFTPLQPAQTSLTQVEVTDLSSSTGGQATFDNGGTPVAGTSAHGMLPFHTCALMSEAVEHRYRGGHPRAYFPIGTTNDLADDGDWKDTSVAAYLAAWTAFYDALIAGNPYGGTSLGLQCAVSYVSKFDNPVPPYRRAVPLVYDIPVDGYAFETKLATQRRRVRRTARH